MPKKRPEPVITQDELMAAIEEARSVLNEARSDPGWFTAEEFVRGTEEPQDAARKRLMRSPNIEHKLIWGADVLGRRSRVTVFRKKPDAPVTKQVPNAMDRIR